MVSTETRSEGPTPLEKSVVNAKEALFVYALRVDKEIYPMVKKGEGKGYVGSVWGRPGERQILLDSAGETLLTSIVQERGIPAMVLGEQNHWVFSEGRPDIVFPNDSLDNSSQFRRGLDTAVYSVGGGYEANGTPIGSVAVNIRAREAILTLGNDNYFIDLSDPTLPHRKIEEGPRRTTIKDEEITIASFLGERDYKLKFDQNFNGLIADMHPKGLLYAGGGAYIYSQISIGAVDIYIMFNEPHSEILPGLPAALAAKCTIISVNPDGTYSDYRFDPSFITDPREYSHGSVPLFIAARTPELAEEAIRYYMKANNVDGEPRRLSLAA